MADSITKTTIPHYLGSPGVTELDLEMQRLKRIFDLAAKLRECRRKLLLSVVWTCLSEMAQARDAPSETRPQHQNLPKRGTGLLNFSHSMIPKRFTHFIFQTYCMMHSPTSVMLYLDLQLSHFDWGDTIARPSYILVPATHIELNTLP